MRAKRAAGAGGWKKNARNNRCHRDYPGARYSRRSHYGVEVDPEDDGEDRRSSSTDRYSVSANTGSNVGEDARKVLPRALDLFRQALHLPPDIVLLIDVRCAQLIEFADFGVDFDFLHHRGISGCNRLDLSVGERTALQIFRGAHRRFSPHHLMDEAGLGFEGLPLDRPIFRHFPVLAS